MYDISIIIPCYNAEKYIGQTLSCLVGQTEPRIEILVVDDGSTDNSEQIIRQFFFDRRIKYFKQENTGTGGALNLGHEKSIGKLITSARWS